MYRLHSQQFIFTGRCWETKRKKSWTSWAQQKWAMVALGNTRKAGWITSIGTVEEMQASYQKTFVPAGSTSPRCAKMACYLTITIFIPSTNRTPILRCLIVLSVHRQMAFALGLRAVPRTLGDGHTNMGQGKICFEVCFLVFLCVWYEVSLELWSEVSFKCIF